MRFRVGTGTVTAGAIIASWWYRDTGSETLTLVGRVEFDKPAADWLDDTEYFYELDSPIRLPNVLGRTYYLAIFSEFATIDATDIGVERGVYYAGEAVANTPIVSGDQVSSNLAVAAEAWGDPASWNKVVNGGGIEEASEDWEEEVPPASGIYPYCTGTMTNPENIIGGVAGDAVSGAQNNYIAIDLGAGMTPTAHASEGEFPDYATSGIRAVSEIEATMVLASGGIIAIMSSEVDDPTMPDISGGSWTLLGSISYVGAPPVTLTITTPTLARWIAIVELGTSATDAISLVEIQQIKTKVDDGAFPISFLNAYHKCWVKNYPIDNAVYKVSAFNASGATSPAGNPFTNRENVD